MISKFSYGITRYTFLGGGTFDYFQGRYGALTQPRRGDVMVFTSPRDNTRTDYIKRVVGVGGDKIQMVQGVLLVNRRVSPMKALPGQASFFDGQSRVQGTIYETDIVVDDAGKVMPYRLMQQFPLGTRPADNTPEYTVPQGNYFCMGDNRQDSSDSREMDKLGFIDGKYIIGPALFVFFSIELENFYWHKPWTWWRLITGIRLSRLGFQRINTSLPKIL